MRADDAGNHRASVYSNTRPKFQISSFCYGINHMNHAQAERGNSDRMIGLPIVLTLNDEEP